MSRVKFCADWDRPSTKRVSADAQIVHGPRAVQPFLAPHIACCSRSFSQWTKVIMANQARSRCAGELKKASIPFTPAVGAIFMWVDLRGALPQPTWEASLKLLDNLLCSRAALLLSG